MSRRLHVPRLADRLVGALPRTITRVRTDPPHESLALGLLVMLSLAALLAAVQLGARWFPPSYQVLPLLGGALLLGRRAFLRLAVVVAAAAAGYFLLMAGSIYTAPGAIVVVSATALVAYELARSSDETGLGGLRGNSVLLELRARLLQQGQLPQLPAGWNADAIIKPAGGGPFAGDFVVGALTGDGRQFEVSLVDVSGKGVDAGTRALLLSGALGGLLGSQSPEHFLSAANAYLVRQEWDEGFATAVHLVVDLVDGRYSVESAGHPPVAHFDAGSGRWGLVDAHGIALGLLPDMTYVGSGGVLRPGDALLLYTDGLVEVPGRDLSVGIDKLLGEAERLVPRGFAGGGPLLVNRVAAGSSDDRGLVLLWRDR